MRPRSRPHVSSSLMLPTDDSLARYLEHHDRTTGNLYCVIRWDTCSETWADLSGEGIFKTTQTTRWWVCKQRAAFPSHCGNVVGKKSACEDNERRESGLSCAPPPGQTGQGDRTAHTHTRRCVRTQHHCGCPDPHTYTSCHFSLISAVPAALYRNRISLQLWVSFRDGPSSVWCLWATCWVWFGKKQKTKRRTFWKTSSKPNTFMLQKCIFHFFWTT